MSSDSNLPNVRCYTVTSTVTDKHTHTSHAITYRHTQSHMYMHTQLATYVVKNILHDKHSNVAIKLILGSYQWNLMYWTLSMHP